MVKRRRTRRSGLLGGTVALAFVMALATAAWACTVNMIGDIWFTSYTSSACTTNKVTSGIAGSTWCSQAAGLQTGTALTPANKYQLRYAGTAADCHNSPNRIRNNDSADGLFTAAPSTGGWSNQRITLPAPGSYVVCAATPAAVDGPAGPETGWWSQTHLAITVT